MRRQAHFEGFRQQVQHGHGQQQSSGKTDGEGQPFARQAEHDQRRSGNAQNATKQAGEDNLQKQGK